MLVTSIFSISYNVFKGLFVRVVKSLDCVLKRYYLFHKDLNPPRNDLYFGEAFVANFNNRKTAQTNLTFTPWILLILLPSTLEVHVT